MDSNSWTLDLTVQAGLTGLCTLDLKSECTSMTHRFMYTRLDVNNQGTHVQKT